MGYGYAVELINHMAQFNRVGFKEISTGWDVKKQIFNRKRGSLWSNHGGLLYDLTALDDDLRSHLIIGPTAVGFDMGNGCN